MVARPAALAGLAVHPCRLHPTGDLLACQGEVDPHPKVLMEHPRPVIPIAEYALVRPPIAHDVAQARAPVAPPAPRARAGLRGSGRRRRPDRTHRRRWVRCSCRHTRPSPAGRRQPSHAARPARRACIRSAPNQACARSARTPRPPGSRRSRRTPRAPPDGGSRARRPVPPPHRPAPPARGSPPRSTSARRPAPPHSRARRARRQAARRTPRPRAWSPAGTPRPAGAHPTRAAAGARAA